MASCSSSDSVVEAVDEATSSDDATYISLTIALTDGSGTRASGLTYSNSTEDYVSSTKSIFLFYDDSGNYVTYGHMNTTDSDWSEIDSDEVSYQSATVQLGPWQSTPTQMVAVLNYDGNRNDLRGKTLSEIYSLTRSAIPSSKGEFLMANALRVNSATSPTGFTYAAPVEASNLCTTEEAATANPVTIYVERQIAKASIGKSNQDNCNITTDDDGNMSVTIGNVNYYSDYSTYYKDAQFKINIDGWAINATNKSSYIVKNYEASWTTATNVTSSYYDEWFDTSNSTERFYWAYDYNYDDQKACIDDSIIYLSWSEVDETTTDPIYVHENTASLVAQASPHNVAGGSICVPTLLVAAHMSISTDDGSTFTDLKSAYTENEDGTFTFDAKNALYYSAGNYYSYQAFMERLASDLSYDYGYTWSDASTITADQITLITEDGEITGIKCTYNTDDTTEDEESSEAKGLTRDGEDVTGTATASDNGVATASVETIYLTDKDGDTIEDGTISADDITIASTAKIFSYGMCYYQAPIIHFTGNTIDGVETKVYGMVRNHYYNILLNTISGVGAPVYDPNEDLDDMPEEDTETIIGVELNILKWRAVTNQYVDF